MNNDLRYFYINGQLYEKVGTEIRDGSYVHTIKLPYSYKYRDGEVWRWTRYKEVTDKELKEKL